MRLDIDSDDYHSRTDYLSASMIKTFIKSRREYKATYISKTYSRNSSAMDLGTVAHAAILEPHIIGDTVIEIPQDVLSNGAKRGKAWTVYRDNHIDSILLKSDEIATVQAIFDSVYSNATAAKLLRSDGPCELSILLDDPFQRRCRIDKLVPAGGGFIVDIKTCRDASPGGFDKAVRDYGYHIQAAFYQEIAAVEFNQDFTPVFIAVASTFPHQCGVYTLSDEYLTEGCRAIDIATDAIWECTERGDWSEPWEKSLLTLNPPGYWRPESEDWNE